jgi:dTDP-glucose 4,6-dehydratase
VYGSKETGSTNEECALKPSNPYSTSKAGADLLVQGYMRTRNLPAVIVRGSNNYGPYQYPEKLIPLSITSMLQDRQIPVHGSGKHVRSWLHVHDFCRAVDTVARTATDYSIYNVSGEEKTNLEVLAALAACLNKDIDAVKNHVSDRPGPDMRYSPDSTRLEQELGWRRLHSFDEVIGEVVRWYQANEQWWRDIQRKPWFTEQFERQSSGRWV